VDVWQLVDAGVYRLASSVFNKPIEEWDDKHDYADVPYVDPATFYFVDVWMYAAVVIKSGDTIILSDTAIGEVAPSSGSDIYSPRLPALLNEIGLTVEDVDFVVHSHLHRDHTGYDVIFADPQQEQAPPPPQKAKEEEEEDNTIVHFPNAIHLLQQREKDYWLSTPELRASCNWDVILQPVEDAGQLRTVDNNLSLTNEVTIQPCGGHTGGLHSCIFVDSNGSYGVYIGDSFHHVVQVQVPDWAPTFDFNTTASTETRRQLVQWAYSTRATMFSPHFAYPGAGVVHANFEHPDDESGYILVPLDALPQMQRVIA